jgi:hypothetical protein
MLDNRIKQLTIKEQNLCNHYTNKIVSFLKKGKIENRESIRNECIKMQVEIFGLEEQLFVLRHYNSETKQIEFINNFNELELENCEIEGLYDNSLGIEFLLEKLQMKNVSDYFIKHFYSYSIKFIKILKEFITKRNHYRRKPSKLMLEELVLLKSNIIKLYCMMKRLRLGV